MSCPLNMEVHVAGEEKYSKDMEEADAQIAIDALTTDTDVMAFVEGDDRGDVVSYANDRVAELAEASAPPPEEPEDEPEPDQDKTTSVLDEQEAKIASLEAELKRRDDADNEAAKVAEASRLTGVKAQLDAQPKVEINIAKTADNEGDVAIGINGHTYLIKRGEWVKVPQSVFEVLENAVMEHFKQVERGDGQVGFYLEGSQVNRFSYQSRGK
jgi:hypothetical protein